MRIVPAEGKEEATNKIKPPGYRQAEFLLKKFGALTRQTLSDAMIHSSDRIDPDKTIHKLMALKIMRRYTCMQGNAQVIDFYTLTKKGEEEIIGQSNPVDTDNPRMVLERLSLSDWHLSCCRKNGVREDAFWEKLYQKDGRIFLMPSLISYRLSIGKRIYLAALAAPRGGDPEDAASFLRSVTHIGEYLSTRKSPWHFVVLCSHLRQMEDCAKLMDQAGGAREWSFLYRIEANGEEQADPLSVLYIAHADGEEVETSIISL